MDLGKIGIVDWVKVKRRLLTGSWQNLDHRLDKGNERTGWVKGKYG